MTCKRLAQIQCVNSVNWTTRAITESGVWLGDIFYLSYRQGRRDPKERAHRISVLGESVERREDKT